MSKPKNTQVKLTAPIYSPLRELANIGNSPLCLAVSRKTTRDDDRTESGRFMYVGSKDRRIRVIDLADPSANISELSTDRSAWVETLIPSTKNPDWLFYASGSRIYLWNTFTDKQLFTIAFNDGQIQALQVNKDDSQLWVSVTPKTKTDETCKIYRCSVTMDAFKIDDEISLADATALSLCSHPTKDIIFAGLKSRKDSDRAIDIFNSQTLEKLGSIEHSKLSSILALKISKDGNRLFAADDKSAIACWDLSQCFSEDSLDHEKVVEIFRVHKHKNNGHRSAVNCLELSEKEDYLFSGSKDNTIRQWDTKDGTFIRSFQPSLPSNIGCLALRKSSLYSGNDEFAIHEWDTQVSDTRLVWNCPHNVIQMTNDDEGNLFLGYETTGQIVQLSAKTGKQIALIGETGSDIRQLQFLRRGTKKYLLSLDAMNNLFEWDISISPARKTVKDKDCLNFFVRKETLLTTREKIVERYGVFWPSEKKTFELESEINVADVDPTARYVFVLSDDCKLQVYDLEEEKFLGKEENIVVLKRSPLVMTYFGPKNLLFLTAGNDVHAYLFDSESDCPLTKLFEMKTGSKVISMQCSPHGVLFVGGGRGVITEWDIEGKLINRLTGHTDEICNLLTTSDGTLFSSSKNSILREWSGTLHTVPSLFTHVANCTELHVHFPEGLDPLQIFDAFGRSLVTFCAAFGSHESLEFLLEKADKKLHECEHALFESIRNQRWGLLNHFVNFSEHLGQPPSQDIQDLVTARILNKDKDFVRHVVRFADFDRCILDVIASLERNEWEEMIDFLANDTSCEFMKYPDEPNTASKKTLLHYAIQKGSTRFVKELFEKTKVDNHLLEAFIDVPNDKQLALNRLECVDMILDAKPDLDLISAGDDSPYIQCLNFQHQLGTDVELNNITDAMIKKMNKRTNTNNWRRNFAIKEFILQFWHYALFLIVLTVVITPYFKIFRKQIFGSEESNLWVFFAFFYIQHYFVLYDIFNCEVVNFNQSFLDYVCDIWNWIKWTSFAIYVPFVWSLSANQPFLSVDVQSGLIFAFVVLSYLRVLKLLQILPQVGPAVRAIVNMLTTWSSAVLLLLIASSYYLPFDVDFVQIILQSIFIVTIGRSYEDIMQDNDLQWDRSITDLIIAKYV